MNKQSWSAKIVAALLWTLCLISCGPNRNDSGAELVSIEVTPANPHMIGRGEPQQFKAIGHYADNSTRDISALVRWSYSNNFSGQVNSYGFSISETGLLITSWEAYYYYQDKLPAGRVHATGGFNWDITGSTEVFKALPESIAITPVSPIMQVGASMQFTAAGTYWNGSTYDLTSNVTWSSSDPGKATMGEFTGMGTAIASGTTVISASWGPLSSTTTVTVTEAALVSIAVTPVDPSMAAGASLQLTATGTYSDATTHDLTSSATWTSSDPGKATVSAAGLATAVAAGTTIISATLGTVSNTTTLTVTGGEPTSTSIVTTGTMTKGSAIVNGIQFDDTLANITADDIVKSAAFLQSGMTVKIKGSRNNDGLTGIANEIHVENAARGAIQLKFTDSFLVAGQTVIVDGGTIFANVASFDALLEGDNVEVHGLRNAAGAIRATRVERLATAGVDEARGTISAKFGSVFTTIIVGSGNFNVDETTTVLPAGTPFDVGTLVEIRLTGLHVDQLKVEDAYDAAFRPLEGGGFEVEGFITGFTSLAGNFFVDGQAVDASDAVLVGGATADLDNDVKVVAKGHFIGSVLVADTIEIKDALRIEANISASDAPFGIGQITLLGKTVFLTSNTVGRGDGGPFTVGEGVQVWGFLNLDNTTITATRIAHLGGVVAADANTIQWSVSSFNASTRHLGILGFDVDASGSAQFLDEADIVVTATQFFGQLTAARSIVKARGTASGSVLTAGRLEIE